MIKYYLMHKNNVCGELLYDEKRGVIHSYRDNNEGISPFLGKCDSNKILDWWKIRSIPASRNMIRDILEKSGCNTTSQYLAKNLALSMTDSYWICPVDLTVKYEDIRFSNLAEYNQGKIPYHNVTSYDPNASLGGQMEKYWDLHQKTPILVKESSKYFGQQSINEVFATYLHKKQNPKIPFVQYTAAYTDSGSILSKCPSFTSDHVEFIPAYEIINSEKVQNSMSLYEGYIELCVQNGIDREEIQDYMDYLVLSDFVISNTDEHLLNFGVLRDSETMKLLGPAPIFDSGNSMFFSDERKKPYTRVEILEQTITSFYDNEEKMLAKVKNRSILKEDLLPSPKEVKAIYEQSRIPEWKADVISKNYGIKLEMLQEFQHGKKISLYNEKQEERKPSWAKINSTTNKGKFIMMCGVPGSGKTAIAKKICLDYEQKGYELKNSKSLYPIQNITNEFGIMLNKEELLNKNNHIPDYSNSVVYISASYIRRELEENNIYPDHDTIFTVAELRIKAGLANGATVVFDASNIERDIRMHYVKLAKAENISEIKLYVANTEINNSNIPEPYLEDLKERFESNYPSYEEGWTHIEELHSRDIDRDKEKSPY